MQAGKHYFLLECLNDGLLVFKIAIRQLCLLASVLDGWRASHQESLLAFHLTSWPDSFQSSMTDVCHAIFHGERQPIALLREYVCHKILIKENYRPERPGILGLGREDC